MSRRRKSGNGRISVHTPEIISDIIVDSDNFDKQKEKLRSHRRSNSAVERANSPHYGWENRQIQTPSEHTFKIQNWLSEKSVRNIQERTDFESRSTKNMYTTLLENEDTFVKEVDGYLNYKSMLDRRKKQMLHKKWSERVFFPVKDEIDREMNGPNYRSLDSRKRVIYKQYLDYSNKKGVVFLDVMSPEEYDPLVLNANRPGPLKAITAKLDDCLIAQGATRMEEDRAILRCSTGEDKSDREIENIRLPSPPLVPLGRHGTECKTWLRMQLHDINSDVRKRSGLRMKGIYNDTDIDFEDISNTKTSPALLDVELRAQKKRQYKEKHATTLDFEWPELPSISHGSTMYHPRIPNVLPLGSSFEYRPELQLNATY